MDHRLGRRSDRLVLDGGFVKLFVLMPATTHRYRRTSDGQECKRPAGNR